MEPTLQPADGVSHDAMDSLVAAIASFCGRLFSGNAPESAKAAPEIAFSDEWERKQMNHELHFN